MKNAKTARLGDVCEVSLGKMLDAAKNHGTPYPYLRNVNVRWGHFDLQDLREMRAEPQDLPRYSAQAGDLVACEGGEPGRCAIWRDNHPILLQKALHRIRPGKHVLAEYLYYLFALYAQDGTFAAHFSGTTIKHLTGEALSAVEIPLPPLATQRAIVARLDSALARAGALEKRFAAIAQNAELSFKATLNEEFAGRTGGTGETGGTGGSSDSRSSSTSKDPSAPSKPWPLVRLGDVGRVAMCKRILKSQTTAEGDIPFFKIGTFGKKPDAFISRETFEEYSANYSYPRKGDVLISAAGTIGRAVVFDGKPAYFQDSNIVWLEHDCSLVANEFLYYFYLSKPWIVSNGATIPRLYNGDIESLSLPLPPLSVQRAIVSRLDAARKRADDIAALARQAAEAAANLRKALLKEAFE